MFVAPKGVLSIPRKLGCNSRTCKGSKITGIIAGFLVLAISTCLALSTAGHAASAPAQKAPQTAPQAAIDPIVAAMLAKTAIIALQHANQTGNYTVLHDMGTPLFRERFDATRLAAIFTGLRARGINLSPVLMLSPNIEKAAELSDRKQLRLVGNFPTQPLQIRYELVFVQIDGVWRIDGLAVDAVPPGSQPAAAAETNAPKPVAGWETKTGG